MPPASMMERPGIVGLLLAAGVGRRFDPTGVRLKLLEPAPAGPHAGASLAQAALRTLRSACPDTVAVVRPADTEAQVRLHRLLAAEGARLAICAAADSGMGHSIACGIAASLHAGGWVVALADMPLVSAKTVAAVRDAVAADHETAAPVFHGQRGHPVAFGRHCRDALLALTGDHGARAVLAAHPPRLIEVDDPGCLHDIDVPTS
jgi:molybdenum cofactor cytidylyltransferase